MVQYLYGGSSDESSPEPYLSPPATPPPPPPVLTAAQRKAKEKEDAKQYKIDRAARMAARKVERAAKMAARKEAREKERQKNMQIVPGFAERSAKRAEYAAKRKIQLDKAQCEKKAEDLGLRRSGRVKEKESVNYYIPELRGARKHLSYRFGVIWSRRHRD